jgi:hypothetical protein
MKKILFIIIFGCATITYAQQDSVYEYGHSKSESSIAFWTCKYFNDTHLIDVSPNLNHGNIFGCQHVKGRRNRLIIDEQNWTSHIDSTGEDRMCLNLNGGFVKAGGVCFDCDFFKDSFHINDFTFSFWAKRDPDSHGILMDFGSDQENHRWVVYNSLTESDNNDSLHFSLLENEQSVFNFKIYFPENEWNLYAVQYLQESSRIYVSRTVSSNYADVVKLAISRSLDNFRFGYAGSMFLGKRKYDTVANNKGLFVDDIGFWGERFDINLLQDYGLKTKGQSVNPIQIYPNPTRDRLTVKLGSGVFNEFHYTIYNSNGQKMLSGKLRNTERTINLSQLSEGLYFISISDETSSVNVNRKLIKLNNL